MEGIIMKVEIHTLAWPNTHPDLLNSHRQVCQHFELNVNYTLEQIPPGPWMDQVMHNSTADVVAFLDVDCVPTNRQVIDNTIAWTVNNRSFVGIAQVSNHINPKSHIWAAPAFLFIWRDTWKAMQCPTLSETHNSDIAENLSHTAEIMDVRYKALYPTHWTIAPDGGSIPWKLHNYGWYGIGTHYEGGVFHLYQGRTARHVELFSNRCNDIIAGKFTTEGMRNCRDF
jgi:hypothetical protein